MTWRFQPVDSGPEICLLSLVPDAETAIAGALNHAESARLPVLVCGSFYLAGKVRDVSENRTSNT